MPSWFIPHIRAEAQVHLSPERLAAAREAMKEPTPNAPTAPHDELELDLDLRSAELWSECERLAARVSRDMERIASIRTSLDAIDAAKRSLRGARDSLANPLAATDIFSIVDGARTLPLDLDFDFGPLSEPGGRAGVSGLDGSPVLDGDTPEAPRLEAGESARRGLPADDPVLTEGGEGGIIDPLTEPTHDPR